jgi:hypothetical protein
MTKERKICGSIAELCGHAASVLTISAYISTDILILRSLAISSGILATTFQYYRPVPLWVPIRWNVLLLAINGYMVTELLIERHRAENMPPDMKRLYDSGGFDERGFSKVQFMKFFEHGVSVSSLLKAASCDNIMQFSYNEYHAIFNTIYISLLSIEECSATNR